MVNETEARWACQRLVYWSAVLELSVSSETWRKGQLFVLSRRGEPRNEPTEKFAVLCLTRPPEDFTRIALSIHTKFHVKW